jgi:hypothetical protein
MNRRQFLKIASASLLGLLPLEIDGLKMSCASEDEDTYIEIEDLDHDRALDLDGVRISADHITLGPANDFLLYHGDGEIEFDMEWKDNEIVADL